MSTTAYLLVRLGESAAALPASAVRRVVAGRAAASAARRRARPPRPRRVRRRAARRARSGAAARTGTARLAAAGDRGRPGSAAVTSASSSAWASTMRSKSPSSTSLPSPPARRWSAAARSSSSTPTGSESRRDRRLSDRPPRRRALGPAGGRRVDDRTHGRSARDDRRWRGSKLRFAGGGRLAVDAVLTLAGELAVRPLSARLAALPSAGRGRSGDARRRAARCSWPEKARSPMLDRACPAQRHARSLRRRSPCSPSCFVTIAEAQSWQLLALDRGAPRRSP